MNIFSSLYRTLERVGPSGLDTSVTALTNLALGFLGMCTGVISARLLGPHGRGELAAVQTTPTVIATLAMIGMPEALVYYTAQKRADAGRYLTTASLIALVTSIPFVVAGYFAMPFLLHAQSPTNIWYAQLYLIIAPLWAVVGMMYHPLRGIGAFRAWNILRLTLPFWLLGVLCVAYITGKATPVFVAFGTLAGYPVLLFPWLLLLLRRLPGSYVPDATKIARMLSFGTPCFLTSLPQILNLRLDQILMAALLPPRDIGLYAVAVAWSAAVLPLLTAIGSTLLPSIASAEDRSWAIRRMGESIRMTAALAIIVSLAVALATPLAIPLLFGWKYLASLASALVLVPAAAMLGLSFSLQEALRGLGHPYLVLRAELYGLAVTACSLFLILRPLGILGASLASLLGYTTTTAILLFSASHVSGLSMVTLVVPRGDEMRRNMLRLAAAARLVAG
jgi:O-antigen/teichoic acid export membrane protein